MAAGLGNVDLNLMVALNALLVERNVTRAAERTMVGQPAMSASLARLRKYFNDPLLVRDGRRMALTPLAESLVQPVQEALAAIQNVMRTSKTFDPAADHRTFTVIASDYATMVLIRPLLKMLTAEAPHVQLNIAPINHDFLDQLRRGQCDLLIWPTSLAAGLAGFSTETLFTDEFVVVVDQNHPEVGESISVEELSRLPYVSVGGPFPSMVEAQLDALGVRRQVAVNVGGYALSPFLLQGTRLVAVLQELLVREMVSKAGLRTLALPVPMPELTEAMYWHPRNTQDAGHQWLRRRIQELSATL